jgi:hypothetical protein
VPECPRCKTICEPSAEKCDCGYELALPADMQPAAMRRPLPKFKSFEAVGVGLIVLAVLDGAVYWFRFVGQWSALTMLWMVPAGLIVMIIGLILLVVGWARK